MTQLKWTTTSQYVDVETGELLTKENATKNYYIIEKHKHKHVAGNYGYVKITNVCRARPTQTELYT